MKNKAVIRAYSKSSIILSIFVVLSVFFSGVGSVQAANPQFNYMSNDLKTLRLGNYTTNSGTQDWSGTITANGGDRIVVDVYYHNGVEGTVANNVKLRVTLSNTSGNQAVLSATVSADNAPTVTDTATLNITSSQTFNLENSARWLPNQQTVSDTMLGVTYVTNGAEVNIGNIAGGWASQGHLFFYLDISNNSTTPSDSNSPVVNAGNNLTVNEGQSVSLSATATDPQGDAMTYSWTCNGGSLSSTTILNPTFNAPSVTESTSYSCTLTVRDVNGNSTSDSVYIYVNNTDGSSYGFGGGGPSLDVSLSASPSTGTSPLNGVSLTAIVTSSGLSDYPLIYRFDCENNNSWELKVETNNTTYTAANLCNYYYDDVYSAKVKVERGGYTAYAQAKIITGQTTGSGYGISVDAGSNKDIGENQSTILNGYAYSLYGYNMSYYWSCNGGSLSNSATLSPTYYAPSVNSQITYTCTLYVTDSRGYKNSDVVNINVRNTGDNSNSGLSVSALTPENVSTSSATLKGIVGTDGGQATSVRFNWGKLSSYSNFTSWIANKYSGQSFNYYISGLEKGKAYHYRIEASNGKEVVVSPDQAFITKPGAVSNLTATGASSSQISLNWNSGSGSCYTLITRKQGGYPSNSNDGKIIYYGNGTSFVDKSLTAGIWYYYRAWAVGCDEGLYSYSEGQNVKSTALSLNTGSVSTPTAIESQAEVGASVEALAKDSTQNEIAWQNSIIASPRDEIEFKIIITPTGGESLNNVVLTSSLSEKIESISDIKINDESFNGSLSDGLKLGTVALGESKIITFRGTIAAGKNFSYGSNELENSFKVSADSMSEISKSLGISVSRSVESEAGLISLIDVNAYAGVLTVLFVIISFFAMYLMIERKKIKDGVVEKSASTKVEKSKYFNIK